MKILLISDKKNWSYDAIAQGIMKFNKSELIFKHICCKGNIDRIKRIQKRYDAYFVLGWQNSKSLPFLDKKRTIVGVHSHQSFDNQKTRINKNVPPSKKTVEYLQKFCAVNTVSARLHQLLQKSGLECCYTPNGVDTEVFRPSPRRGNFVASCVAARKNDWNKGVQKIIRPSCEQSNVELINSQSNRTINRNMPEFYNKSHCYICASKSEGMPLSVLEAAACGCVIISTSCGDIIKLVENEYNGFLVKRTINDISCALDIVKSNLPLWHEMSVRMRQTIEDRWSWQLNASRWTNFLQLSLDF